MSTPHRRAADLPLQVSDQERGTTYSSQPSQLRICSRSLGFFHFLKRATLLDISSWPLVTEPQA